MMVPIPTRPGTRDVPLPISVVKVHHGDYLREGECCASTSNRNFEGRQGRGGRTHLAGPAMAAATAIAGHFVDIRDLQ